MKKLIHIPLLFVFLMASCKREKPLPPEGLPPLPSYAWANYIGTYDVYDTLNHVQWVMKISHLYHSDRNNGNEDSILIENFANKFNIRDKWHPAYDNTTNEWGFRLYVYHPILDMLGNRWHLSGGVASNGRKDNIMRKDSVTLYFKQSNIAFYQSDGVPYYDCDCNHIAVKR